MNWGIQGAFPGGSLGMMVIGDTEAAHTFENCNSLELGSLDVVMTILGS